MATTAQEKKTFFTVKRKTIVFLFTFFLLIVSGYFLFMPQQTRNDLDLVLFNIRSLKKNVEDIQTQIGEGQGQRESNGRIDPTIIKEFGEDELFIEKIVTLKKERMLAQLSIEVADLQRRHQSTNLAQEREMLQERIQYLEEQLREKSTPTAAPVDPWPTLRIIGINASEGTAHVQPENQQMIRLSLGKIWQEFSIIEIERDFVRLRNTNTGDERSFYIAN